MGGTVGDIESMVFLEALRQFQFRVGRDNMCFVHVSLVPCLGGDGEQKTKPTQHGVKELRSVGLSPDMIICRSSDQLLPATCHKIALFCHVAPERVLSVHTCTAHPAAHSPFPPPSNPPTLPVRELLSAFAF